MATHSSILAWRIPWTEEPGGLPSIGSHRVEHNWSDLAAAVNCILCSSQLYSISNVIPKGEFCLPLTLTLGLALGLAVPKHGKENVSHSEGKDLTGWMNMAELSCAVSRMQRFTAALVSLFLRAVASHIETRESQLICRTHRANKKAMLVVESLGLRILCYCSIAIHPAWKRW